MNIGIVGLGLIGGSLAKSIKSRSDHSVLGFDIDSDTMDKALLCGAIDGELNKETLKTCQIVLVALYPAACVKYILDNAANFAENTYVLDCAGVKRSVCPPLEKAAQEHGFIYIGGHPMAGREFSGFGYAKGNLFERAAMILTPSSDVDIEMRDFIKKFFLQIGFRTVRLTTAEEHDSMIAYTSQLAHIVSGAYVKNPLSQKHRGFSAGSFLDMTRVARLNENMWTELCLDNADLLVPAIDDLIFRLSQYRDALQNKDEEMLCKALREGRLMKESLD